MHQDSLGVVQPIRVGAVNLMTAGRGIVHSERAGDDLDEYSHLHGIQSWIALPAEQQECEPAFVHYPAAELPQIDREGTSVRIMMGRAVGAGSPVTTYSRTLYLDCRLEPGAELALPEGEQELAVYVAEGDVEIEGEKYATGVMAVACPGKPVALRGGAASRVMVIGGDTLGEREIFWNFVSNSKERIEQAKQDWRDGNFAMVPGDHEFIPLPE